MSFYSEEAEANFMSEDYVNPPEKKPRKRKGLGNPVPPEDGKYYKCPECGGISNFEGCLRCRNKNKFSKNYEQ